MIKIDKRSVDLPQILNSQQALNSINSVEHKALHGTLKSGDFDMTYERIVTNFSSYLINEGQ